MRAAIRPIAVLVLLTSAPVLAARPAVPPSMSARLKAQVLRTGIAPRRLAGLVPWNAPAAGVSPAAAPDTTSRPTLRAISRQPGFRGSVMLRVRALLTSGRRLNLGNAAADQVDAKVGSWGWVGLLLTAIGASAVYNLTVPGAPDGDLQITNVAMSAYACIATSILLIAQRRQATKDRARAEQDLKIDEETRDRAERIERKLDLLLGERGLEDPEVKALASQKSAP